MKPPRTQSRNDMSCSEASTPEEHDEIAEREAEVISKEVSETRSLGSDKNIPTQVLNYCYIIISYAYFDKVW